MAGDTCLRSANGSHDLSRRSSGCNHRRRHGFGSRCRQIREKKERDGRLSRIGAAIGFRTKKTGQMPWFAGYKKHAAYALIQLPDQSWHPLPIASIVKPGNVKEQQVARDLLELARLKAQWKFNIVVADQGYVDGVLAGFLRREWQVAMLYKVKTSMTPPPGTDPDGCPTCPSGQRLVWHEYDSQSQSLIYGGDRQHCSRCPLAASCPRVFEFDAGAHESFWGMIPTHSRLAKRLLDKFRPRAEPGFNIAKNRHGLQNMFLNSLELTQILCVCSDLVACLDFLALKPRETPRELKIATRPTLEQPELWS